MTNKLTFNALRGANTARLPQFRNKHGALAHSKADGSDWSPAQWLQAVVGELGEYANLRKKFERGDVDAATFKNEAAKELADVVTYLDILAMRLGIDLGQSVMDKFNEISARVGSLVRLGGAEWFYASIPPMTYKGVLYHRTKTGVWSFDSQANDNGPWFRFFTELEQTQLAETSRLSLAEQEAIMQTGINRMKANAPVQTAFGFGGDDRADR